MPGNFALTREDIKYGSVLIFLGVVFFLLYVKFNGRPIEDAAMLLRYAQHLGQGKGIVWNVGARPVDGATDFLFVLALGGGRAIGINVLHAAFFINITSHLLTVLVVYYGIRRSNPTSPPSEKLAFVSAAYLVAGPGFCYMSAYFGTPFFALWAALSWYFVLQIAHRDASYRSSWAFAVSSLLMSLTRPEGVFLTIFMLLSLVYWQGFRSTTYVLRSTATLIILFGGVYFAWRWHYFGYPLPNAYYKKGAHLFYSGSVREAVGNIILLCLPCLLPFVLAFRSTVTSRLAIFVLIPVIGWAAIWVLLSNEMNFLARYQYAILPVVLMSWPGLVQNLQSEWHLPSLSDFTDKNRKVIGLANFLLFLFLLGYQYQRFVNANVGGNGLYTAGRMLREYKSKNYTLATTEAGLLPYYSEWKTIDTWGLNDAWIAHHGYITDEYLDRYKPDMLVVHTPLKTMRGEIFVLGHDAATWSGMVSILRHYASTRKYVLAAAWGLSPENTYFYYVRADCPDCRLFVTRIRQLDFTAETGQIWYNFADSQ
jgi:arabinofuranosyltransferase